MHYKHLKYVFFSFFASVLSHRSTPCISTSLTAGASHCLPYIKPTEGQSVTKWAYGATVARCEYS